MIKRWMTLAAAGAVGAALFAGPGLAGSNTAGAHKSKYDEVTAFRECNTEGEDDDDTAVDDRTHDVVTYAGPGTLWPPNHKQSSDARVTSFADQTHATPPTYDGNEHVELYTMVDSNEDVDQVGSGNTSQDSSGPQSATSNSGTASTSNWVLAERAGGGTGREYTIDFAARFEENDDDEDPFNDSAYWCSSLGATDFAEWYAGEFDEDFDDSDDSLTGTEHDPFVIRVPHDMSDPDDRAGRNIGN